MSGVRDLSRRKWTVLTAVFAAIAVIAAMVTVPVGKAEAAEPADFTPNMDLGSQAGKGGADATWGDLVWAGAPEHHEGATDVSQGNSKNNVGWGWCIDPLVGRPMQTMQLYDKDTAGKAPLPDEYHDAAIGLAMKLRDATKRGDKAAAANYSVYLVALLAHPASRPAAALTITGEDPSYGEVSVAKHYPKFTGSAEEFKQLTGLDIVNAWNADYKRDPNVEIPDQPKDAFITIVGPDGALQGKPFGQRVMPPDQPGLPDTEEEQPEESTTPEQPSSEETTEDEPTEEESTPNSTEEQPSDEETSSEETTSSEEPSTEQTTTKPSTEPSESTPTTSASEKKLQPKIGTKAEFADDADQVVAGAKVKDTVHYEDLVPHKEYTLEAELKDKAGDNQVVGKGKKTFTPEQSSGDVDVEITVDSDLKKPIDAAVAFETLTSTEVDAEGKSTSDSDKKNVIAEHKDLSDEAQTVNSVWNPEIATKAKLAKGETVKSGAKVTDTVKYKDLVPGKKYTLNAELVNKADESVIGKGEKTFTPKKSAGKVDVEITVDSDVKNPVKAAVAFEELTSTSVNAKGEETPDAEKPNHVAEHKDINDKDQTVNSKKDNKPSESSSSETSTTSSKPSTSESKSSEPSTESSSESETSEPSDSETSTSKTTTSTEPSSTTSSEKPEEPADTSAKPEISTNADFAQGSHEVVAGAEIVDEVSYEGLVPGKEYTLQAELISKADKETVLGKGETTFTPEKSAGKVDVKITVDSDVTEPVEAAVAFEELTSTEVDAEGEDTPDVTSDNPNHIAEHKDINDEDQTVPSKESTPGDSGKDLKPEISTKAKLAGEADKVEAGAKVTDTVEFEDLVPGREYTLNAELVNKADESVIGEGEKTFTPETSAGSVDVEITVDSDVKNPVKAAVAFEELTSTEVDAEGEGTPDVTSDNPNHIAEHKDIDDEDQTVTSEKKPEISTNADFAQGSHEVVAGAEIVDEVSYEGLVPGKEYTLQAELISKADQKTVLGKGETTFTPEKSAGKVDVKITVDSDVTEPVEAAVAFEELTSTEVDAEGEDTPDAEKPNEVAEHKDIDDKDQTVTSDDSDVPGKPSKGKIPKWAILIPGIGLGIGFGKIIFGHHDHDHGHHDHDKPKDRPEKDTEGHGEHPSTEVKGQDTPDKVDQNSSEEPRPTEVKGQDTPDKVDQGTDKDDRPVEVMGQEPGKTGKPLPSDAGRTEIKSVPSGATELEPGVSSYIQ